MIESVANEVPKATDHPVSNNGSAHRTRNHETDPWRATPLWIGHGNVHHEQRASGPASSRASYDSPELRGIPQSMAGRKHTSSREFGAALATPGCDDRPTRPGAHSQPEAVHLRTTTVVRLEGALTHSDDFSQLGRSSRSPTVPWTRQPSGSH